MNRFLPGAAGLLALLAAGCLDPFQTAGGGTSDTDNAIASVTGETKAADGSWAAEKTVLVRLDSYLSPFPALGKTSRTKADLMTDGRGRFRIDSLDPGDYFIEVRDGDTLGTLFQASIGPGHAGAALGTRALDATGELNGTVLFRAGTFRAYVQVYGMERRVAVDSVTGRYRLRLPAGRFTLRFVDPEKDAGLAKIREVTVTAGGILELDTVALGDTASPYHAWRHSAEIEINTTADAGGAGTREAVTGFPLLVRLDPGNFDFSEAMPDGRDIRFCKADGRIGLPYEIERWDAASKRAEVWVLLDTIRGDLRYQTFQMYWGNTQATAASEPAAVFAADAGNAAVWHLGDAASAGTGAYRDASGNGNHGTGAGMADSCRVEGAIGWSQAIDGDVQHIAVPDAPSLSLGAGDFTLSAWVRADSLYGKHQILGKRTSAIGEDYEIQVDGAGKVAGYAKAPGLDGTQSNGTLTPGSWHQVAFSRAGTSVSIYIDGKLDATATVDSGDVDGPSDLWIGQDVSSQGEPWKGALDEIRVGTRALPADWIKLSFANQSEGSAVLTWRRFP